MSLKYVDLGITDDLRAVVTDVKAGEVYLFDLVTDEEEDNPFDAESEEPELVLYEALDFFSYKAETIEETEVAGRNLDGIYKVKVAQPTKPLKEGLYTYINFSDGAEITEGVLMAFTYRLSTLVYLKVDSTQDVPKTWEEIVEGGLINV